MREVPHIGRYPDVIAHADTLRFESGLVLPVINLEKLIRAKELSGRPKDTEVLLELRARRALALARASGLDDLGPEPSDLTGPPDPPQRRNGDGG